MVSKSSSVRSIRLPNETWAALAERAEKEGVAVNALVGRFVDAGLNPAPAAKPAAPKQPPARAVAAANKAIKEAVANPPKVAIELPVLGSFERKPMQKGGKK